MFLAMEIKYIIVVIIIHFIEYSKIFSLISSCSSA